MRSAAVAAVKGAEAPALPAGARRPWVKPVVRRVHEVTATATGTKQPGPSSYEGRSTGPQGDPTPFETYGPIQQL